MANWTRTPEVMDALVTMFTAALPADGSVVLLDGPPVGGEVPDSYVAVGYAPAFSASAFTGTAGHSITGNQVVLPAGNRQRMEQYEIQCEATTWTGDSDPGSVSRQRLATRNIFNLVAATLAADPTVGGTVTTPGYASISSVIWLVDQASTGCAVSVMFGVEVVEQWLP